MRVNPNAAAGVYHAYVSFPSGTNRDEAEQSIAGGNAPGVIVNVTVDKKTVELLNLSVFNVDRFVIKDNNDAVHYLVKNTGDDDVKPTGDIIIYNGRGEEAGTIPVNPDGVTVKAGESKTFTANVPLKGLIGKYKAYLSLHYGSSQLAQLQDTAYFYAIPWKKLVALFIGVLLIALALSLLVHRRYGTEGDDDGSDQLPMHVRDHISSTPIHHDIDMKSQI